MCMKLARELRIIGGVGTTCDGGLALSTIVPEDRTMWTKPDFTEMRFGFEITMYIGNR